MQLQTQMAATPINNVFTYEPIFTLSKGYRNHFGRNKR